jgi:AcrR family transcriptional regulator
LRLSPEKKEEKERVRKSLMRATLRLAAVHGFASLGLREVAREAGIAPTSFYRHFADMAELGLALIREQVEPMIAKVEARVKEAVEGDGDVVAALIDGMLEAVREDPELVRFMLAERRGAFAPFRENLRARLLVLSQALRPALKPPTPPYAAELSVITVVDACDRALEADEATRETLRAELVSILQWLLGRSSNQEQSHD